MPIFGNLPKKCKINTAALFPLRVSTLLFESLFSYEGNEDHAHLPLRKEAVLSGHQVQLLVVLSYRNDHLAPCLKLLLERLGDAGCGGRHADPVIGSVLRQAQASVGLDHCHILHSRPGQIQSGRLHQFCYAQTPYPETDSPVSDDRKFGDFETREQVVLKALGHQPLHVDTLADITGYEIQELLQILMSLELKDCVTQLPGKTFIIKEE